MSGSSSVSAANGFIDLATFSELESFLYGGPLAISWFVAGVQKANWFTVVPIQLRNNGTFGFGAEGVSASLNRSGDYVLNVWFRCEIPTIVPKGSGIENPVDETSGQNNSGTPGLDQAEGRWTRHLMHNLIKKCSITFNELTVEEFDNYWLDFNYMFRVPASKRVGYKNMIGDIPTLLTSWEAGANKDNVAAGLKRGLYGGTYSVVLPFWFGEDSGIALPVAALPFNDVKINYEFRRAEDLLVLRNCSVADLVCMDPAVDAATGLPSPKVLLTGAVQFRNAHTYAHYAVIHNDERTKMGDAPRDMLIRQVQTVSVSNVRPTDTEVVFDVRLSHSIVAFFFAMRNASRHGDWSNYTTNFDMGIPAPAGEFDTPTGIFPTFQGGRQRVTHWDPISRTQLIYENTLRLDSDSDFFSVIHPYLFSDAVADEPGYHMWSYAIKPWDHLGPSGSSNFSKLANVQVRHTLSPVARYFLDTANSLKRSPIEPNEDDDQDLVTEGGNNKNLKLSNVFVATNHNIARVANGSLGHPTL